MYICFGNLGVNPSIDQHFCCFSVSLKENNDNNKSTEESFFFNLIFLYSRFLLVLNFTHISVYMSIPISQFIPPPLPPHPAPAFPLGVHTFVLYICVYRGNFKIPILTLFGINFKTFRFLRFGNLATEPHFRYCMLPKKMKYLEAGDCWRHKISVFAKTYNDEIFTAFPNGVLVSVSSRQSFGIRSVGMLAAP